MSANRGRLTHYRIGLRGRGRSGLCAGHRRPVAIPVGVMVEGRRMRGATLDHAERRASRIPLRLLRELALAARCGDARTGARHAAAPSTVIPLTGARAGSCTTLRGAYAARDRWHSRVATEADTRGTVVRCRPDGAFAIARPLVPTRGAAFRRRLSFSLRRFDATACAQPTARGGSGRGHEGCGERVHLCRAKQAPGAVGGPLRTPRATRAVRRALRKRTERSLEMLLVALSVPS